MKFQQSISPKNTVSAPPCMKTGDSLVSHEMSRSPPDNHMMHFLEDILFCSIAATAHAHAPVPHASVSPAPLSHVLCLSTGSPFSFGKMDANSMFDLFGNNL